MAGCLRAFGAGVFEAALTFLLPRFFEDWALEGGATRAWIFCKKELEETSIINLYSN